MKSYKILIVALALLIAPILTNAQVDSNKNDSKKSSDAVTQDLIERVKGRILLQVEDKGKSYYVDPLTEQRAYLGKPADALKIMSELGLGISNVDLAKIASPGEAHRDLALAKRLAGRIVLQVEEKGEAFYVSPTDFKKYYLGKPRDAFDIMRNQGLGITNNDLDEVPVFQKYKERVESLEQGVEALTKKIEDQQQAIGELQKQIQQNNSTASTTQPSLNNFPTATSTPSSLPAIPAIPAIPAVPATPSPGNGTPAVPATPATPAVPATPATPATPDITPPAISNVQAINITETSAAITWTTNESASSEVFYALSSPITATSTIQATGANNITSHSASLTGLSSSKTHYYVAVSKDAAGNTATSSEQSFATLTPPPPTSNWSNNSLNISGEYQSIAWNGNGYGAVYGWNGKLYFIKLDSNGSKLSESVIATAPNYVFWTNIVWDGSKYGVVWPEANPHNLRFATVDIDGSVLSSIPVTTGTDNASTERPALVWIGSEYVLAWSGGWPDNFNNPYLPTNIVYFTKISSDGQTLIINKKKAITSGDARAANGPIVALAWNGANLGVVWQDIRDSGDSNNPALYFNVLDSNGDRLISNDVKISGVGRVGSPQIFVDGSNYTVFWRESAVGNMNANSIYVAKIDSTGNKVLANQNLNTKGDNEMRPSVAKTDSGYGIVWTSYTEQKLYFKSINSSAGIIIDNELISTISGSDEYAYVVWGSNKYAVIWVNIQNNQLQLYFGSN